MDNDYRNSEGRSSKDVLKDMIKYPKLIRPSYEPDGIFRSVLSTLNEDSNATTRLVQLLKYNPKNEDGEFSLFAGSRDRFEEYKPSNVRSLVVYALTDLDLEDLS